MALLSTLDLEPAESFELWREVTRGTYDVALPTGTDRAMRLSARIHYTPSLTMSEFWCQRNQKWRDRKHLARDARPYIKLRRYLDGGATMLTDGRIFRLRPGATYLLDQSRTFTELSADNRQRTVFLPHELIRYNPERHGPIVEWPDDCVEGQILIAAIDRLWDAVFLPDTSDSERAENAFIDTLRAVLDGAADSFGDAAIYDARVLAIEAAVDRLVLEGRPHSIEEIISRLPVSRASLYRHFRGRNGIARHLRRRRIDRAFHMLGESDATSGAVGRIAERAGFGSIHSFCKTFKRETGFAPSEVLGTRFVSSETPGASSFPAKSHPGAELFAEAFRRVRGE